MEFELLDGKRLVVPLHVIADTYEYSCEYLGEKVDALVLHTTTRQEFYVKNENGMVLWHLVDKLKTLKF